MNNKGTDKQYMAAFCYTIKLNSSLFSFVPNFRILSQVVAEKSLTEKKVVKVSLEREKNEQIKGLISNIRLFFVIQYNSSLSSFVPNFTILSQVQSLQKEMETFK